MRLNLWFTNHPDKKFKRNKRQRRQRWLRSPKQQSLKRQRLHQIRRPCCHSVPACYNGADFGGLQCGPRNDKGNIDRGIAENGSAIARIEAVSNEAHEAGRHMCEQL